MSTFAQRVSSSRAVSNSTIITFFWLALLLVICYAPVLSFLISDWSTNEDMGHGFFVPVIAGYIVWQNRQRLKPAPLRPNYAGLAIILFSALQLYIATLGAELFLARTAFVFSLVGIILYLGGTYNLKVLFFPLFLLLFMIPIPAIIYNQITFPLQLFASAVAESVLSAIGIPVLREGNVLELANQKLSVVEACSGIRSLLSLGFLSLVYAYFFDNKVWMRAALLIATVPIAIIANASRVTLTGILTEYKPEYAEGFFHSAQGWLIFMVALVFLVTVHKTINLVHERYARYQ
jgi:exosortase